VREVVDHVKLTTWAVTGPDLLALAVKLRALPGVQHAVVFGTALHVSGDDAAAIEAAITPFRVAPYEWTRIRSGLEDVFIHLIDASKDNFAP
jgi:ABC-2 type transport system ATP-binding protein